MRQHANMQAICQSFHLKKTLISNRFENESTQTRSHIVDSAERRREIFANVEHSTKSAIISSKNDVHRRSDDSARDAIFAAKRKIVDELYIVA
jgi:hypothetical protein